MRPHHHLCFADDLLLFCHGDSKSVKVLKMDLDEFGSVFGLFPSFAKISVYFGNVKSSTQDKIRNIMPFNVDKGKAKVRRSDVYLPKNEGGLGIKSLKTWNNALMSKHILNNVTEKESIPLRNFISKRRIYNARLSLKCKLADVVKEGEWNSPMERKDIFHALFVI
ncbi:hypothetical protein Tco_0456658 [Tanacetum coccineum]